MNVNLNGEEFFTIREMRQEDLAQVRAIDQVSFTMPWPESAYKYELNENPLSLLWVAVQSTASVQNTASAQSTAAESGPGEGAPSILGMVVVWLILDEAHIATIAVRPDQRQKGIAQWLLAEALQGAIGRGAHEATLEVRLSNVPAQKLYRRFRFEVVGERRRYYRDNNEDALIMTVKGLDSNYLAWLESGEWRCRTPQTQGEPS